MSIFFGELVAIFTVCSSGVYSAAAKSSKDILFVSNHFKMFRINAPSVSAHMVYAKTIWNFTKTLFIRKSMSKVPFTVMRVTRISGRPTSGRFQYPAMSKMWGIIWNRIVNFYVFEKWHALDVTHSKLRRQV